MQKEQPQPDEDSNQLLLPTKRQLVYHHLQNFFFGKVPTPYIFVAERLAYHYSIFKPQIRTHYIYYTTAYPKSFSHKDNKIS